MNDLPLNLRLPARVEMGAGALSQLTIESSGTVLISGRGLDLSSFIEESGMDASRLFFKAAGEPDSDGVDRLAAQIRERIDQPVDRIMAIGGGSTIDTAKAVALLLGSGGKIAEYEFGERPVQSATPLVVVPTTCGSGSEATPYTVINNSETARKFTLGNGLLLPERVIIDPMLLTALSPGYFLAGVLDTFIHAFEARFSMQGNRLINPFAEEAMNTILKRLTVDTVLPDQEELTDFAQAAFYGGVSIAHSRTGLIHTLSVAFARYVKVPHGILNACIAPYVLRFNRDYYGGELGRVLGGLFCEAWTDSSAVDHLSDWIGERVEQLRPIPSEPDDLVQSITARVLQDGGLPAVNPRPLSRELLEELVGEILVREFGYRGR